MSSREVSTAFVAGLLSSGLFLLVGIGLIFFMFLPTLPLFYCGFRRQLNMARIALLVACAMNLAIAGPTAVIFYLIFLGLPTYLIILRGLMWREADGQRHYYPVGLIFLRLTLYACGFFALTGIYFADMPGGLPVVLSQMIRQAFVEVDDTQREAIDILAGGWSFLVVALVIWLWGLTLYVHAWAVIHWRAEEKPLRPDFTLRVFAMPRWVLSLIAICALASLIGSPTMMLLGKASLISLMMPYFLLGIALMNRYSLAWPQRRFFLFMIYFLVFTLFWPGLVIAGIGLWHQLKELNNYLSSGGTSSKS